MTSPLLNRESSASVSLPVIDTLRRIWPKDPLLEWGRDLCAWTPGPRAGGACRDPGAPLSTDGGGHGQGGGQCCKVPGPAPRLPRTPQSRLGTEQDRPLRQHSSSRGYRERGKWQTNQRLRANGFRTRAKAQVGGGRIQGLQSCPAPPHSPSQSRVRPHLHTTNVFSNSVSPSYIHE